jgi:hypothetical protein
MFTPNKMSNQSLQPISEPISSAPQNFPYLIISKALATKITTLSAPQLPQPPQTFSNFRTTRRLTVFEFPRSLLYKMAKLITPTSALQGMFSCLR